MSIEERLGVMDPAAPGATVGRIARLGGSPMGRLERAVASFNRSEAVRTVAGLTRTLGSPSVSVGVAAGAPEAARITVAWELCWYQWAVDLGDGRGEVLALAKGEEVEQLDGSARQWNARAGETGRLALNAQSRWTS